MADEQPPPDSSPEAAPAAEGPDPFAHLMPHTDREAMVKKLEAEQAARRADPNDPWRKRPRKKR